MIVVESDKRSYILGMSGRQYSKSVTFLKDYSHKELQTYIDDCFTKASRLSRSHKGGAWVESRMWRDKAKLAILIKEGLK